MQRMSSLLVIREWFDHALKLGGADVRIIRAWFGVPDDPARTLDVTEELSAALQRDGSVWLRASTFVFGDPAPLETKHLVVIFDGDNVYSGEAAAWSILGCTSRSLLLKAASHGALAAMLGPTAAIAALSTALPTGTLVLTATAAVAVGYRVWSRSPGDSTVYTDARCPICLDPLSADLLALTCGHCFHRGCLKAWLCHAKRCPICNGTEVQGVLHPQRLPDVLLNAPVAAASVARCAHAAAGAERIAASAEGLEHAASLWGSMAEAARAPLELAHSASDWAQLLLWA